MKSRFVRAVIETVQQDTRGAALGRLRSGLPPHLLRLLSRDVLGPVDPAATLDLDLAIELLLATDGVLCGGSGVVTARATAALASRVLSLSTGLVVPGDTVRTLQHLSAPFEQPFVGVELRFSARRTAEGFVLELALPGRPRAARWLCSAGLGYARAAAEFSGNSSSRLRLGTELIGDVARVLGRQNENAAAPVLLPHAAVSGRDERLHPSGQRRRSSATNIAAQVDQILNRTAHPMASARAREKQHPPSPTKAGSFRVSEPAPPPPGAGSGVRPAQAAPAARTRKSAS